VATAVRIEPTVILLDVVTPEVGTMALYYAKKHGRNRLHIYSSPDKTPQPPDGG